MKHAEPMVGTCIITGYGINADIELGTAFETAGARAERVHIGDLIEDPSVLRNYQILAFPGGFSFGDHLGSGLVFAALCKRRLQGPLEAFVADGKLIIGICNGFQVLVKMGVLPNLDGNWTPHVTLIHNAGGVFDDRWVDVAYGESRCIWTRDLPPTQLPIRNGEGRFMTDSEETLHVLENEGLIAVRYSGINPNGSEAGIAGLTDRTGRILGLMPHPEAFLYPENHPLWSRTTIRAAAGPELIKNGVDYCRQTLCPE